MPLRASVGTWGRSVLSPPSRFRCTPRQARTSRLVRVRASSAPNTASSRCCVPPRFASPRAADEVRSRSVDRAGNPDRRPPVKPFRPVPRNFRRSRVVLTAVFDLLLEPGDVLVDVGANVGYYTALGARAVGPAGHVYAIEPAPDTAKALRQTVEGNGLRNVTVVEVAAGASETTAALVGSSTGHDEMSTLAHARGDEATTTVVQVRPVHALVEPRHRDRLALAKIDVEGYEAEVLTGLEPLLRAGRRPTIVLEVHAVYAPNAPASVADFCARTGYRASRLIDDEGPPYELAPADRRVEILQLGSPDEIRSIPGDRFILVLKRLPAGG